MHFKLLKMYFEIQYNCSKCTLGLSCKNLFKNISIELVIKSIHEFILITNKTIVIKIQKN